MTVRITRRDPRYAMLQRSRNLRWDGNPAEAAAEMVLCFRYLRRGRGT